MLSTLQVFRGVAAMSVAAYHLSISFSDPRYLGHPVLEWLTWRMGLGVDFFFVLSGFIILLAHEKDIGRPARFGLFVKKRFARIYPAYWVYAGTFSLLVALGFGTVASLPDTPVKWLSTVLLIRFDNFLTPISPAWTLFHEIAFYGVFALLILNKRLGIAAFVAWQVTCLALFRFPQPDDRTPFNTYFAAFNFDFVLGMATYYLYDRKLVRGALVPLGAGAALLTLLMWLEAAGRLPLAGLLLYPLSLAAIILGACIWERERQPRPVQARPVPLLLFLGEASYSIYLTHNAFEGLFIKILMRLRALVVVPDALLFAIVLGASIAAGCVAHLLVERPALRLSRLWLTGDRRRAPPLVVSNSTP